MLSQLGQLALEAAGENWEPAPGLGVEVLVVQVERGCVALALPLVAAPEPEESLHPRSELLRRVLRKLQADLPPDLEWRMLVADRQSLDRVQQIVRHEVGFVGLMFRWWAEFRGWRLAIHRCQFRNGTRFGR